MSENLGGLFDGMFGQGGIPKPPNPPVKKPEKGLPWRAKTIDGKMYLPLEQVVELLKTNDVLPAVRRGLERHLPKKEENNGG